MSTPTGSGSDNRVNPSANNTSASSAKPSDSIILEEEIDPNYVPTEAEVVEYATWLGMDLEKDKDLFFIAREGLKAPLPENWKPCKTTDTDEIYYFNFATGESTWDHPCDEFYRTLYEKEKKAKLKDEKTRSDTKKKQAKKDVEEMLGKEEKKKKKEKRRKSKVPADLGEVVTQGDRSSGAAFDRKPLPGLASLSDLTSSSGNPLSKPVLPGTTPTNSDRDREKKKKEKKERKEKKKKRESSRDSHHSEESKRDNDGPDPRQTMVRAKREEQKEEQKDEVSSKGSKGSKSEKRRGLEDYETDESESSRSEDGGRGSPAPVAKSKKKTSGVKSGSSLSRSHERDGGADREARAEEIDKIRRRHAEEIEKLERNHEKEMAAIEKKKGKDIKNATSRAEQRVEAKIKELKRKHEEKLKDIEDEYSEEIKEEEDKIRRDRKEHVAQLKSEMEEKIASVKKECDQEVKRGDKRLSDTKVNNKLQIKQLEEAHTMKLKDLRKSFAKVSEKANADHERKMKELASGFEDEEIDAVAVTAKAKALSKQLKAKKEELEILKEDMEKTQRLLDSSKAANRDLKGEAELLKNEVSEKTGLVEKYKDESKALEKSLEDAKKEMRLQLSDDENVQRLQTENSKLAERVANAKAEGELADEEARKKYREKETELVEARKKVAALQSEAEKAQRSLEAKSKLEKEKQAEDDKENKTSFSFLLRKGKNVQFKKKINLGFVTEDVSGRRKEALGSAAEASSATTPGLGSGSMSMTIGDGGEVLSKAKVKSEKVVMVEKKSKMIIASGSSGPVQGSGSGSGSGFGSGSKSGAMATGSAAGSGNKISLSIPGPGMPSPVKQAPAPMFTKSLAKKADFAAPNGKDYCGTIVIHMDPNELLSDAKRLKRFSIDAMGEICRALSISNSMVQLSNVRAYPVLVDITILKSEAISNYSSTDAGDIILKLADICRDPSSAFKTAGSGVLATAVDLVPLLSSSSASPATPPNSIASNPPSADSGKVAELQKQNKDNLRTIATLKANLQGYHEAKQQMNENLNAGVSNAKELEIANSDLQTKLGKAEAEVESAKAELKVLEDKVAIMEQRLEQSQKLLDASSNSAGAQTAQLLKDLGAARSKEDELRSTLLSREREVSELQHQLSTKSRELESLKLDSESAERRSRTLQAELHSKTDEARNSLQSASNLTSELKSLKLENQDLSSRVRKSETEASELRTKVQGLLSAGAGVGDASLSSSGGQVDEILQKRLSSAVAELSATTEQLHEAENKANEARKQARETDVQKHEIQSRLAQKASSWESESRSFASKIGDLEASVNSLRSEKVDLVNSNSRKSRELEEINRELRQIKNTLMDEEMARRTADREKEYVDSQVTRFKKEVEESAKAELRMKLETERLEAEKMTLRTKLSVSEAAVRELNERVGVLERQAARSVARENEAQQQQQQPKSNPVDKALMEKIDRLESEQQSMKRQISEGDDRREEDGFEEEKAYWSGKVSDEKKLLTDAKSMLKEQKDKLKKRQKKLERSKISWRKERSNMDPNDNRKRWELKELKRKIDREAEQLNAMVGKLRKTQSWLSGHEDKVSNLEGVIRKMIVMKKKDKGGDEEGDQSILNHVQELQRITETIDRRGGQSFFEEYDDNDDDDDFGGDGWGGLDSVSGLGRMDDGAYRTTPMMYPGFVQQPQYQPQQLQQQQHPRAAMNAWAPQPTMNMKRQEPGNIQSFQSQLKEWTRDRAETQREVGYHVSWLDDLRKDMTTNLYGGDENTNPGLNMSATANALLSPRKTVGIRNRESSSRTLTAREI